MQVLKVPTEAHAVGIEMKIINANKKIFFYCNNLSLCYIDTLL